MANGFSLGRILGVQVTLDWSLIFIFLLITWNLSTVFASRHPDWATPLSVTVAAAAAVLFLASILVHELAHSLVALRQGVPVRKITLFMFGGVAEMEREPPSPRAEFLITIVGPLSSFILGVIFFFLGSLIARLDALASDLEGVISRLAGYPRSCCGSGRSIFCWRYSTYSPAFPWTAAVCCAQYCGR